MKNQTLLLVIAVLMMFSCHKKVRTIETTTPANPGSTYPTITNEPETGLNISENNNKFAFDIYAQLYRNPGNVVFSPFSISTALAMTYEGAREQTELEISKTAYFNLDKVAFHTSFKQLLDSLKSDSVTKGVVLKLSNGIFVQKGYSFLDRFYEDVKTYYNSGFDYVDYQNQPEKARLYINKWAYDNTSKKIQNLIPEGVITSSTRLILANAIYFLGSWDSPFDPRDTRESEFFLLDGNSVEAPFMNHDKHSYRLFENTEYQAVVLPYLKEKFSMVVVLPTEKKGITKLEESFRSPDLKNILDNSVYTSLYLHMPKFNFSMGAKLGLELSQLGMMTAFSDMADFSGMTGKKEFKIDEVIHKAVIEVDEKGTVAAAVTAVLMGETAVFEPKRKDITVDHPFLFFIVDNQNQTILFMGRVTNPLIKG